MYNPQGQRVPVNAGPMMNPRMGFPGSSSPSDKSKKQKMIWIIVGILALLLIAIIVYMMMKKKKSSSSMSFMRRPQTFGFSFY